MVVKSKIDFFIFAVVNVELDAIYPVLKKTFVKLCSSAYFHLNSHVSCLNSHVSYLPLHLPHSGVTIKPFRNTMMQKKLFHLAHD